MKLKRMALLVVINFFVLLGCDSPDNESSDATIEVIATSSEPLKKECQIAVNPTRWGVSIYNDGILNMPFEDEEDQKETHRLIDDENKMGVTFLIRDGYRSIEAVNLDFYGNIVVSISVERKDKYGRMYIPPTGWVYIDEGRLIEIPECLRQQIDALKN